MLEWEFRSTPVSASHLAKVSGRVCASFLLKELPILPASVWAKISCAVPIWPRELATILPLSLAMELERPIPSLSMFSYDVFEELALALLGKPF